MTTPHFIFWICLAVLFYCYIGYGILLFMLNGIRSVLVPKKKQPPLPEIMPVTLVVAAFNEGAILEDKIRNTLAIRYPVGKLSIIFITDGSTDGSPLLVKKYPAIRLLHANAREGKYAAITRAMSEVSTPVVVFSDANTMLNEDCLEKLVSHYKDPRVGGVAGEKKVVHDSGLSAVGEGEGLYWRYESLMKRLDAGFHTIAGASGELFSIRTRLFRQPAGKIILDDFVISMQVCLQGYKIAYEPGAYAIELPSSSIREEFKRKIRISAGAYQSIGYLKKALNVFAFPLLSFQYISRRLLRWILCPLLLVMLLLTNVIIVTWSPVTSIYSGFLTAQLIFYLMAGLGWSLVRKEKKAGLLIIPFYFVFMNYCLVTGFFKFIQGTQTVLWERSERQVRVANESGSQ